MAEKMWYHEEDYEGGSLWLKRQKPNDTPVIECDNDEEMDQILADHEAMKAKRETNP